MYALKGNPLLTVPFSAGGAPQGLLLCFLIGTTALIRVTCTPNLKKLKDGSIYHSLPLFSIPEHWLSTIRINVQDDQGLFSRREMKSLTFYPVWPL